MTPQELKNSILQLAIQGKLVEQRPEEDTAEELYQQIQAEKQMLIKAGKIKKEKPLPEIAEDEKPFDIPDNWIWVRLSEIATIGAGGTPDRNNPEYWNGTIPWLKISDITSSNIYVKSATETISEKGLANSSAKVIRKGAILYTIFATIGEVGILDFDASCNQAIAFVEPHLDVTIYLYWYLVNLQSFMRSLSKGCAQFNINQKILKEALIALPPLAEQKRIVAKIEELLPLIDRYEEAWTKLEAFNKRFPGDMQKSLLQMAIQGKLVEQRPVEGTGEELYTQIQAEKQALIKSGKIKKDKPLPEITDDEKPFDIPDSWKWVRLSEICNVSDGTHQTPKYVEHGMPFISAQNVKPYKFMPEVHRDVSFEDYQEYNKQVSPKKGDILMTRVGAGIGEAAIIDQEFDFSIYVSLTLIKCYLSQYDMSYILSVLNSPLGNALAKKKTLGKGASQGNLNLCFIREFVFPLPPFAEQKRIVAKLEQLLPLCERLK